MDALGSPRTLQGPKARRAFALEKLQEAAPGPLPGGRLAEMVAAHFGVRLATAREDVQLLSQNPLVRVTATGLAVDKGRGTAAPEALREPSRNEIIVLLAQTIRAFELGSKWGASEAEVVSALERRRVPRDTAFAILGQMESAARLYHPRPGFVRMLD